MLSRLAARLWASVRGDVGGYELLDRIGEGGTGVVWRARRKGQFGSVVALKRLRGSASQAEVARLRHEADVLADLDHPRIVRVLEVVHDADGVAIVMPYAAGGSLERLLALRERLPPDQAVAVMAPIADALGSAHRRGVVHGDLKPANILFTADGEPLLSDFGVARSLGGDAASHLDVAGTAEYLDPEVAGRTSQPDARSDLYSVGVVLYEALVGRPPYRGNSPRAVLAAADAATHQPVAEAASDLPPSLAAAVERAMHRRPDQRFPNAEELAGAVRAGVGHQTAALPDIPAGTPAGAGAQSASSQRGTRSFGPRPPVPRGPGPPSRRWLGFGAVFGVAFLLLAGVGGWLWWKGSSGCPPSTLPAPAPGAVVLRADMDGDGCATVAVWENGTLQATVSSGESTPRRYRLGRPEDVPLLGDWDCDGDATPALYRPSTGEAFYFNEWGGSDQPLASSPAAPGTPRARPEVARVTREGRSCDEVRLTPGV